MLSKNLENLTSYDIFFIIFWKKARVYYTLSISRGGGAGPRAPPLDSPLKRQSLVQCLHELSLAKCSQLIVNEFISEEIDDMITFICST